MYLSNHPVLASRDVDELRDQLGKQFTPHELNVTRCHHTLDARVNSCALRDLGLAWFSYGEGAPITAQVNDHQCSAVISLNFLTSGGGCLRQGREALEISAQQGLVIDMLRPFALDLHGYGGVALTLRHAALRRHALGLFGARAAQGELHIDPRVDLNRPAGRALRGALAYAMGEMNGDLGRLDNPIGLVNLENYLLSQLLTLHPNSLLQATEAESRPRLLPRQLKRARDYIHAHAREPLGLEALARYAGCSYRSLQAHFARELGLSPMAYLKRVRLEGLRGDLLAADPRVVSVAQLAKQWGFVHMGRLAKSYTEAFGRLPSETLNRKV